MVKVGKNHKASLVHLSHATDGESGAWGHRAAAGAKAGALGGWPGGVSIGTGRGTEAAR